jgi:hypothetical protein
MVTNWLCVYIVVSITPVGRFEHFTQVDQQRLTIPQRYRYDGLATNYLVFLCGDSRTVFGRDRQSLRDQARAGCENLLHGSCEAGQGGYRKRATTSRRKRVKEECGVRRLRGASCMTSNSLICSQDSKIVWIAPQEFHLRPTTICWTTSKTPRDSYAFGAP